MKILRIIITVGLVVLMTACGQNANEPTAQIDFGDMFVKSDSLGYDGRLYDQLLFSVETENGVYFMDNSEMIHFYDFDSGKSVLVCNKPECRHDRWGLDTPEAERCNAHLGYTCIFHQGFVYDGSLYIITADMEQRGRVIRSDLDRSNQEVIAEFETTWFGNFYVRENIVYFSGAMPVYETGEYGVTEFPKKTVFWLYGVDLRTGQVMELTERRTEYNGEVSVISAVGDDLYLSVNYCNSFYDGTNWDEADNQIELYDYDITTGEMNRLNVEITAPAGGAFMIANGFAYLMERESPDSVTDRIVAVDLGTGVRTTVTDNAYALSFERGNGIFTYTYQKENGEFIYIYNTATGEMVKHKAIEGFFAVDFLDKYVYGYDSVSPDGSLDSNHLAIVTKEAYYTGGESGGGVMIIAGESK